MADTGSQLRTKVLYNLGDRTDKDTECLVSINNAIERLGNLHDWANLQETHSATLLADTETITLPEYTKSVVCAWYEKDSNYFFLEPTTAFRHDRNTKGGAWYGITEHVYAGDTRTLASSVSGNPRTWFKFGNAMYVYPIPTENTTIWLRVVKKPDTITADTEHNLGEHLNRCIVLFATSEMYASLGLHDDARAWEARAIQAMREARDAEANKAWTPKVMLDGIPLHR